MVDIWGYRLALRPNEKCARSSFKASQTGSTIHDASYHQVYEVSGEQSRLQAFLSKLGWTTGTGSELHLIDLSEMRIICPIKLLVRPDSPQCWIIVHPSATEAAQNDLFARAQSCGLNFTDLSAQLNIFEFCGSGTGKILEKVLAPFKGFSGEDKLADLLVHDPRLTLSKTADVTSESMDVDISNASLWNSDSRQRISSNQASDDQINSLRASKLIPGEALESDPHIPALICQMSTSTLVFLPQNWARPLWKAFIFAGARVAGLEQMRHNAQELGRPVFPYDYPGTAAYEAYADGLAADLLVQYNKKPSSKRINYEALGIQSPFKPAYTANATIYITRDIDEHLACGGSVLSDGDLALGEIIISERGSPEFNSRIFDESGELLIGFITEGFFSLAKGKGSGIGACKLSTLLPLLKKESSSAGQSVPVVIQNASSTVKRKAVFKLAQLL